MTDRVSSESLLREQAFVDGRWIGRPDLEIRNPATGACIGRVPNLGAKETDAAVTVAAAAFRSWSQSLAKERALIMRRWFDLMIVNRDALAELLTQEQGKPLEEALVEIEYAAAFIEFYAEEAKRIYGEIIPPHVRGGRILIQREPIGVVAAITPWNFPAAMITRKVGPAIAAGCTAIVKPAPETPFTALAIAVLAEKAGVPPGVLNVITGDAQAIGRVLTQHPAVRLISFTGSTEVGKLLMREAASTVKKVALELGGNAPFIVFDDADLEAAADGAVFAKFRNMGQTCVCVNRIYVQASVHDAFIEVLSRKVEGLRLGNGLEQGIQQGPLINDDAIYKVERHLADAVAKGATIRTGGKRHGAGRLFFEPTVLSDMTDDMLITREETFGPIAAIYRFADEDEAIKAANETPFGLASYFYSRDVSRIFRVAGALEYGMVGINSGAISTELAPFGGIKESGIGREGSRHGIEEYTELKYMMIGGLMS